MPDTQHGKQLSLCYPTGTGGAGQCSRAKPILIDTVLQHNNPVSPGLSHQGSGSLQNGTEPREVWDRRSYQIHGKERSHSPFIKEETRLRQVQPRVQGHTNTKWGGHSLNTHLPSPRSLLCLLHGPSKSFPSLSHILPGGPECNAGPPWAALSTGTAGWTRPVLHCPRPVTNIPPLRYSPPFERQSRLLGKETEAYGDYRQSCHRDADTDGERAQVPLTEGKKDIPHKQLWDGRFSNTLYWRIPGPQGSTQSGPPKITL